MITGLNASQKPCRPNKWQLPPAQRLSPTSELAKPMESSSYSLSPETGLSRLCDTMTVEKRNQIRLSHRQDGLAGKDL